MRQSWCQPLVTPGAESAQSLEDRCTHTSCRDDSVSQVLPVLRRETESEGASQEGLWRRWHKSRDWEEKGLLGRQEMGGSSFPQRKEATGSLWKVVIFSGRKI